MFSTVFNREKLLNADIFSLQSFIDVSIYLRALLSGDAFILQDIVGIYRIHSENLTTRQTPELVIAGLHEKRKVYNIITENEIFMESDKWWFNIVKISLGYYILFTNPNVQEFNSVKEIFIKESRNNRKIRCLLIFLTILLYCEKIPGIHRLLVSKPVLRVIRR